MGAETGKQFASYACLYKLIWIDHMQKYRPTANDSTTID